jgi:uncharacterized membrane protein YjjP (DUF1212 family)
MRETFSIPQFSVVAAIAAVLFAVLVDGGWWFGIPIAFAIAIVHALSRRPM